MPAHARGDATGLPQNPQRSCSIGRARARRRGRRDMRRAQRAFRLCAAAYAVLAVSAADARAEGEGEAPESEILQEDLSLVELLNMKVSLPTRVEQQQDEAPAIVSVITRRDIEAYGARDVADVLRLVPGFEFGVDVLGMIGAGQR